MPLPPVTDLNQLPLVLTLREISAVYRVSVSTIRRGLHDGTFSPRPFERNPYRWNRDDVAADLQRPREERHRVALAMDRWIARRKRAYTKMKLESKRERAAK